MVTAGAKKTSTIIISKSMDIITYYGHIKKRKKCGFLDDFLAWLYRFKMVYWAAYGHFYTTKNKTTGILQVIDPNIGVMLGQRVRRWLSFTPTLGQCIVLAGCQRPIRQSPINRSGHNTIDLNNTMGRRRTNVMWRRPYVKPEWQYLGAPELETYRDSLHK